MSEAMTWTVTVGEAGTTTATFEPSPSSTGIVFVCGHGAGGHMADRSMLAVTEALRGQGLDTVRFNFLYRERTGRRTGPDPMPRLRACFEAVVADVRSRLRPRLLILGGRSMGGRVASMIVSDGETCDGVLLLAYPLHPPGRLHALRVGHLEAISVPVLCINGTRDSFCTPALMYDTLAALGPNWRMHWLDGADHSFHVLKRSGRTNDEVLQDVARIVAEWSGALGGAWGPGTTAENTHAVSSTMDCSTLGDGEVARLVATPGHAAVGAAESELCRRFARRVRLYGLRHLRHPHDADDLAQRVLLVTIQKLRSREVRDPDRIGPFVLGVARTLVHDHRRSRRPEVEIASDAAGLPPLPPPDRDPFAETLLARCLAALAERERSVVVQTYFGEARSAEIARSMAVAEGHVRVLRHRAIGRLRDCMGLERIGAASPERGATA